MVLYRAAVDMGEFSVRKLRTESRATYAGTPVGVAVMGAPDVGCGVGG